MQSRNRKEMMQGQVEKPLYRSRFRLALGKTYYTLKRYTRHNLIHRRIYGLNGGFVDDEFVVENHAIMMYSPFLPGDT